MRITGPDGKSSQENKSVVHWRLAARLPGIYTCKASSTIGSRKSSSTSSFDLCVSGRSRTVIDKVLLCNLQFLRTVGTVQIAVRQR